MELVSLPVYQKERRRGAGEGECVWLYAEARRVGVKKKFPFCCNKTEWTFHGYKWNGRSIPTG